MSKRSNAPAMEGQVSRAVDFNLKKEDLMLLILEGRKEMMEEKISEMQTVSTKLTKDLAEAEKKLKKKIESLVWKTLNSEAKKLAASFGEKVAEEDGDVDEESAKKGCLSLTMTMSQRSHQYTRFQSGPIGKGGSGAAYVKSQTQDSVKLEFPSKASIYINLTLHGKTFANKADIFSNKSYVRQCAEYSKQFTLVEEHLDFEAIKVMAEYKAAAEIAEELGNNESLLSDILSEYDLFNRNQPRAKAKMIKEVLSRDEAGQALLGDIVTAAKGVKLLQVEAPKG